MSQERPDRLHGASWVMLAVVAVLPALFASGITSDEVLRRNFLMLGAGLATLSWGIETLRARKVTLDAGRAAMAMLAIAGFITLSLAWGPTPGISVLSGGALLSLFLLTWVFLAPTGRRVRPVELGAAISIGTAVTGLWGVLDAIGVGWFSLVWDAPGAAGAFGAREFASAFYPVALPLAAMTAVVSRQRLFQGAAGLALLLGTAHFALVSSVPTAIALFVGAAVVAGFAMMANGARTRALVVAGIMGAVGLVGVIGSQTLTPGEDEPTWAVSLPMVETFDPLNEVKTMHLGRPVNPRFAHERMEELPSEEARDYLWATGLRAWEDSQVVGQGPGSWWMSQSRYTVEHPFTKSSFDVYPAFRSPHNFVLKLLVEYGIVGLGLLALFLGVAVAGGVTALRASEEGDEDADDAHVAIAVGMGVLVTGLVVGWFTPMIELATASTVWMMSVAMMLSASSVVLGKGWSASWSSEGGSAIATAILGILLGVAVLPVAALDGVSSYWRGVGDQFMLNSRGPDAIHAYRVAEGVYPVYAEIPYNIGLALSRAGKTKLAKDDLMLAKERRPDDARFLLMASINLLKIQRFKDAEVLLDAAIARFPRYIEAYKNLALARGGFHDYGSMTKTFEEALAMDMPPTAQAAFHAELGEIYEGPAAKPTKALEHFRKALKYMSERNFLRDRIAAKIPTLEKRIERERLIREGKPVPPEMMPKSLKDAHGHDHGHDHGHNHGGPPGGMIRGLTPVPPKKP